MTMYDDNVLASRFAAVAPEPLAGDWDDVIARAAAARTDPTRLRYYGSLGRRRRLVVALAVVALVAVVTATAIGGVREFVLDQGFLGLAPEGATPSSPESGELVLHYWGRSASHAKGIARPQVQVWVYADGRIIWSEESGHSSKPPPEGATELISGYLEQRLTPEGIEFMRSQVADLFDHARAAVETLPTDWVPLASRSEDNPWLVIHAPGSKLLWGSLQMREDDHLLGLQWSGDGGVPASADNPTATQEQVSDLLRIDALLTNRESVLPASAWAVRKIRAYVPSHYAACFWASPPPSDEAQLLSLLPTRAADLLGGKSWTRVEGDIQVSSSNGPLGVGDRWVEYCSKVRTEEAREVAKALSGLDPTPQGARLQYSLAKREDWWEGTSIYFEPYFPDGTRTCSVCG